LESGSSPRVWGKRWPDCCDNSAAGSSPRVWGKRIAPSMLMPAPPGSSPRVWGKRWCFSPVTRPWTVHPHACGENWEFHLLCNSSIRFIPTRVGKTLRPYSRQSSAAGSSPRVWGKRSHHAGGGEHRIGSSPRVWGKPRPRAQR